MFPHHLPESIGVYLISSKQGQLRSSPLQWFGWLCGGLLRAFRRWIWETLLPAISGELGIPASECMGTRAPDTEDFVSERVAVTDQGRDVQERALHVSHMHAEGINVDGGHVQLVLVVDPFVSEGLCQGNDHGAGADTGFLCADERLLLDEVLGFMHEHLRHRQTHRIRCEALAGLEVVDIEAMIQSPQHIRGLVLQTHRKHAEQGRKLLELFGLVLMHNRQVLLLTSGFGDGIGHVAQGDGGQFDEMPENCEEMLTVGELADGMFEGGKIITCRLWLVWFVTPVCGHRRLFPLWCSWRGSVCQRAHACPCIGDGVMKGTQSSISSVSTDANAHKEGETAESRNHAVYALCRNLHHGASDSSA